MFYVELIDDNGVVCRKEFSTELEMYRFLWEGLIVKPFVSDCVFYYYSDDGRLMELAGYGKDRS